MQFLQREEKPTTTATAATTAIKKLFSIYELSIDGAGSLTQAHYCSFYLSGRYERNCSSVSLVNILEGYNLINIDFDVDVMELSFVIHELFEQLRVIYLKISFILRC